MNRHDRRAAAAQEPKWRRDQARELMSVVPDAAKFGESHEAMLAFVKEHGFPRLVATMLYGELGRKPTERECTDHVAQLAAARLINVYHHRFDPTDRHALMVGCREVLVARDPAYEAVQVLSEPVLEEMLRLAEEQLMASMQTLREAVSA